MEIFVTSQNIEKIGKNGIFVFGTGNAAEIFTTIYEKKIVVKAFVDNSERRQKLFYHGLPVFSFDKMLSIRQHEPLVIAVFKGAEEIMTQMKSNGLIEGEDYFLWDDLCYFHKDKFVERYILKMQEWWANRSPGISNNVVLLEAGFINMITLLTYGQACIADYLCKKYQASLKVFMSRGGGTDISPVVKEIIAAMGSEGLISSSIEDDLYDEAQSIFEQKWNGIKTWYDWDDINIYGIDFGRSFVRDYLRYYIPSPDSKGEEEKNFLLNAIKNIVFWKDYLEKENVKSILLIDGVNSSSYLRDLAISKEIPVYIMTGSLQRATYNHTTCSCYKYFNGMWNTLNDKEKEVAIKWGQEHLESRVQGNAKDIHSDWDKKNFSFALKVKEERILEESDNIKVVICPHSFEEDACVYGGNLFADNYYLWLCHLGELSEKTEGVDWYLKPHPSGFGRDKTIIEDVVSKFNNIKLLTKQVSPWQLKKEGVSYALTVGGSIGHEYPYIGIDVINAGDNPHESFEFNYNPTSIKEYDDLILSLGKYHKKINKEEMYRFYALNYLIYDWDRYDFSKIFFWKKELGSTGYVEFRNTDKGWGTWIFKEFLETMPDKWHETLVSRIPTIIQELDEYKPNILYKKREFLELT